MNDYGPIAHALGLFRPCLVAVMGSGGKTGLIRALAAELASREQKILISTTTKIYPPQANQGDLVLLGENSPNPSSLAALLRPGRPLTLARRRLANGKLAGFPPEELSSLLAQGNDLWLLVEADGSAGRPLKAWAPWEPVVPPNSEMAVMMLGGWGLGKPLNGSNVHRPELFAAQSGLDPGGKVTPAALAKVVLHPSGPLSRLPEPCKLRLVVTGRQAAGPDTLAELARQLQPGFARALSAGLGFRSLSKLAS